MICARFHIKTMISRIVNEANNVLDSYYFKDGKYKLSIKDIQVNMMS